MSSNIIKLLIALCLLMLLVLGIEWLIAGKPENQRLESLSRAEKQQDDDNNLAELRIAKQPLDSYTDMVERPLFIRGRKPILEDENDQIIEEVGKIDDVVLLGIYSVKGHTTALFNKKGADRKYLKKAVGEDISGWLLKEIQTDRVIMEQAGKQQTVMLRKPKPKVLKKRKLRNTRKPKPATPKQTKSKS